MAIASANRLCQSMMCVFATVVATAVAAASTGDGSDRFAEVEAHINALITDQKIPSAAFALVQDGKLVHEGALGLADKESNIAATVTTPYPLASVTKPIVATLVMQLVEQKKLELDGLASRYVGGLALPQPANYTIRQLLNHTSGLGTYARIYWQDQAIPQPSLTQRLGQYSGAMQRPGVVSEYSNLGYGLLGYIVEAQTRQSLADLLKQRVFKPLGMGNASLHEGYSTPANAAIKYSASGERLAATANDTPAAGNIYASARDLAKFGAYHLQKTASTTATVLTPSSKSTMRSYQNPSAIYPYYGNSFYGLGWYSRELNGEPLVWHEGGMPGASAIIVLLPAQNLVVTVVINSNDANTYAQSIASQLLRVVNPQQQEIALNAIEGFERYSGQQSFSGKWQGNIMVDGKQLAWAMNFNEDGSVVAEFSGDERGLLPSSISFNALVRDNLLVATLPATLPAADVVQADGGYVLLRLLRDGDALEGSAIAYAAPNRLEHLYPFKVVMQKLQASSANH